MKGKLNKNQIPSKLVIEMLDKFGRHVSKQITGKELEMVGELSKFLPEHYPEYFHLGKK